jgi:hypothetical protein
MHEVAQIKLALNVEMKPVSPSFLVPSRRPVSPSKLHIGFYFNFKSAVLSSDLFICFLKFMVYCAVLFKSKHELTFIKFCSATYGLKRFTPV